MTDIAHWLLGTDDDNRRWSIYSEFRDMGIGRVIANCLPQYIRDPNGNGWDFIGPSIVTGWSGDSEAYAPLFAISLTTFHQGDSELDFDIPFLRITRFSSRPRKWIIRRRRKPTN